MGCGPKMTLETQAISETQGHFIMCVCMGVYACASSCPVCMPVFLDLYVCMCMFVYQCACTYTYMYRHMYMCMYVCTCGVSVCACLGLCADWCLCECVLYRQPPLEGMPALLLGARWWCRGEGSAGCRKKIQRRRKYVQGAEPSVSHG